MGDPLRSLEALLAPDRVLRRPVDLLPYESDALTAFRQRPRAVAVARSRDEVIEVVRWCHRHRVPFVARGSGTSLSGGSLPVADGIVLALNRLDRILDLDPLAARAVVEPGVINLDVSRAAEPHGLYYAPDPSSQSICTVGGNVAFNSGGAHCLRHGMTSNHVLGLEVVLADGTVTRLGGAALEGVGPDLSGLFVGSEGLFGVALEITLRLLPRPERYHTVLAAYPRLDQAGDAVARVLGAGLLPGALEIMDRLAIEAAEAAVDAGYPRDAEGLLIVELEGEAHQVAAEAELLEAVLADTGPFEVRVARDAEARAKIWRGRKGAFSAVGRLSPDYLVQDGVVPRTRLGEALATIEELSAEHGLRVANVFHAGDGNLHPLILYEGRRPGELERAETLAAEILRLCIRLGGSITGEHGIGVEKREFLGELFAPEDLEIQRQLCRVFDPEQIANPGKGFPLGIDLEPMADAPQRSAEPGDRTERVGIVEHDPEELTLTVRAGTPLAELEEHLAEHRQQLPFEPPLVDDGSKVGDAVELALAGSGRLRGGGVRDAILGIRWLDGRRIERRAGGRVVKNAAGFDLPKLWVGSLGRLGMLTEVTLKVVPRPAEIAVLRARLEGSSTGVEALAKALGPLARSPLDLDAADGVVAPGEPGTLWVRIGAPEGALERRRDRVAERLAELPGVGEVVAVSRGSDRPPWQRLRSARRWSALLRLPLPPTGLAQLAPELESLVASGCRVLATVAGQVVWLAWPGDLTAPPDLAALERRLRDVSWRGLVLRWETETLGPSPGPVFGAPLAGEVLDRVLSVFDPGRSFSQPGERGAP